MQISDITPFFVPVVGAVTAFLLPRESALRRSRTAALEDLQVHERAIGLLKEGDPLADQIMAHARTSLLRYHGARVASDQRGSRIAVRVLLAAVILASWVVVGAWGVDDFWGALGVGAIGGLILVVGEEIVAWAHVRRALKGLQTHLG